MTKKMCRKIILIFTAICSLIFVSLNMITDMNSFDQTGEIWRYYLHIIFIFALAVMFSCAFPIMEHCLKEDFYDDDDEITDFGDKRKRWTFSGLRASSVMVQALAVLMLAALALESIAPSFTFYTSGSYIAIGSFSVNKMIIFYIGLFLVFPFWVQTIFAGMKSENYSRMSVLSGCLQLVLLSVTAYVFFMMMLNVRLAQMAVLYTITIGTAIWKYAWKDTEKKGGIIGLLLLYIVLWMGFLLLFYEPGQSLVQYIYGDDWSIYQQYVRILLDEAAVFGPSSLLRDNIAIQEFLRSNGNYLHSILYYWGYGSAVIVIGLLIVFLTIMRCLLGKRGRYHRNYLIYHAVWWGLAYQVIVGILYSLGLLPFFAQLPFSGQTADIDAVAVGLLVNCFLENQRIDALFHYVFIAEKDYLDNSGNISVTLAATGEPYTEYDFFDWLDGKYDCVVYISGIHTVNCNAYWEDVGDRQYVVFFWDTGTDSTRAFMLEFYQDTKTWGRIADQAVREQVKRSYLEDDIPCCLEGAEEVLTLLDEEP